MDSLAEKERSKYSRIWEYDAYRRVSPGMKEVQRAYDIFCMKKNDTIHDYGSGPCRATKWFEDKGLKALAIDFVDNAREEDVKFLNACLWDLPKTLKVAKYGFCCDVIEHIPGEKVYDVLTNIAKHTKIGVYFRISTSPDKMGQLIGEPLHLTVNGSEFWIDAIKKHFSVVNLIQDSGRDIIVTAFH